MDNVYLNLTYLVNLLSTFIRLLHLQNLKFYAINSDLTTTTKDLLFPNKELTKYFREIITSRKNFHALCTKYKLKI